MIFKLGKRKDDNVKNREAMLQAERRACAKSMQQERAWDNGRTENAAVSKGIGVKCG